MPKKGKIEIRIELCKACGLCMEHCPTTSIHNSSAYNAKGYQPAEWTEGGCNGCGICALMCPEAAIEVWRE